jgi:hypothetical protein
MAAVLFNTGSAATIGYLIAALALAIRVEWLHAKGRAPDSPSIFGWFGINLIRAILVPTYLRIRDPWTIGLVWTARVFGAIALAMIAYMFWADARAGFF